LLLFLAYILHEYIDDHVVANKKEEKGFCPVQENFGVSSALFIEDTTAIFQRFVFSTPILFTPLKF